MVWDWIAGNESGADSYRAKNPMSSAAGKYQMTDPFLIGLAKKYRPDYLKQYGGEAGLIDAHYNTPALQEEFKNLGDQDNAKSAKAYGLQYDDKNKGVFWRLGAPNAMKVYSADPSTPLESLLGEEIMKVNPDFRGKTAGDVLASNGYPGSTHGKSSPGPMRMGPSGDWGATVTPEPQGLDLQMNMGDPVSPSGQSNFGTRDYFRNAIMGAGVGLSSITNPSGAAVAQRMLEQMNTPKQKGMTAYQAAKLAQDAAKDANKEDEWDKQSARAAVKMNSELSDAQSQLEYQESQYNLLQQYLNNPKVYQGPAGEEVNWLKSVASSFMPEDKDLREAVNAADAIQAISNRLALSVRSPDGKDGGLTGNTSERDLQFLKASVPGLNKQPGANQILVDYALRLNKRNMEANDEKARYLSRNRTTEGLNEHMKAWKEAQPDLFANEPGFEDATSSAGPVETGVIDYRDL